MVVVAALLDPRWKVEIEVEALAAEPGYPAGVFLILGLLVFGLAVGWIGQLVLGMGTKPNAQSLIAGVAGPSSAGWAPACSPATDWLSVPAGSSGR